MRTLLLLAALASGTTLARTWEYATLTTTGRAAQFNAPARTLAGESAGDLARQLGCGAATTFTHLLNCIGRDSWELVTIYEDHIQGATLRTWVFKRPFD